MDIHNDKIALVHELLEVENPDVLAEVRRVLERNRKNHKSDFTLTAAEWEEIEKDNAEINAGIQKRIPAKEASERLKKMLLRK